MTDDIELDLNDLVKAFLDNNEEVDISSIGMIENNANISDEIANSVVENEDAEFDQEKNILENIQKVNQAINEIPKESYIMLKPLLIPLSSIFKDITDLLQFQGQRIHKPSFQSSNLIKLTQDGTGIYLNLSPDAMQNVKQKFINILEKVNTLDVDFSNGNLSHEEFNLMRNVLIAKLIELIRISIL